MRFLTYLSIVLATVALEANEVEVCSPEGDSFVINVDPQESFSEVIDLLKHSFGSNGEVLLVFSDPSAENVAKQCSSAPARNYYAELTVSEKEDLSYIINTLGMSSLAKIALSKSSIKKAGKRIDHIHPLKFLSGIFTDQKMIASMHAMKDRTWVWDGYLEGITESLDCETKRNNMKPEYIQDFAKRLGININLINPVIKNHQWKELVYILINTVPRNDNADRYDM